MLGQTGLIPGNMINGPAAFLLSFYFLPPDHSVFHDFSSLHSLLPLGMGSRRNQGYIQAQILVPH